MHKDPKGMGPRVLNANPSYAELVHTGTFNCWPSISSQTSQQEGIEYKS